LVPVRELPYARSFIAAPSEAGQMAASDYVPIFFKNRLHLAGRPQMSSRPSRRCAVYVWSWLPERAKPPALQFLLDLGAQAAAACDTCEHSCE
jgi:hypothetical protein